MDALDVRAGLKFLCRCCGKRTYRGWFGGWACSCGGRRRGLSGGGLLHEAGEPGMDGWGAGDLGGDGRAGAGLCGAPVFARRVAIMSWSLPCFVALRKS